MEEEFRDLPRIRGFDLNVFGFDLSGLRKRLEGDKEKHLFNAIVKGAFKVRPPFLSGIESDKSLSDIPDVKETISKLVEKEIIVPCTGDMIDDKTKNLGTHKLMQKIREYVIDKNKRMNSKFYLPNIPELIPLLKSHYHDMLALYMRNKDIRDGELSTVTNTEISEAFGISPEVAGNWLKRAEKGGVLERKPKNKRNYKNKYVLASKEHLREL